MRLPFLSLQVKVLGVLSLGLVAAFGALIVYQSSTHYSAMMASTREAARDQVVLMAAQLVVGIRRGDQEYLEGMDDHQEGEHDFTKVAMMVVVDAHGAQLKSYETFPPPTIQLGTLSELASAAAATKRIRELEWNGYIALAAPVIPGSGGPAIGAVAVAWEKSELQSTIFLTTIKQAGLAVGGALLMMLLLSLAMHRMILRPFALLSAGVKGMQETDDIGALSPDLLARRDEMGDLANSFSGLLVQLSAARATLIATSEAEITKRTRQLDAALANMSQGLCMFDAEHRLVVSNRRFADIFALPEGAAPQGMHVSEVLDACRAAGNYSDGDICRIHKGLRFHDAADGPWMDIETIRAGVVVAASRVPMSDGGWVMTFEDITERRIAEAKIEHMAHHDALTGLPNRVTFRAELGQALARRERGGKDFAVLCLDLDHFKAVNDTLGHPVGDALLQAVAERLRGCLRKGSVVSRLGGDEFAVIEETAQGVEEPQRLAERIIASLSAPYEVCGHQVVIGTSVGIALAPADGTTPDTLVKAADMALYRAKADGRGTWRFFESEMDARMQRRRELEMELRKALPNDEFEVHYQPIVNLGTDEVSCFEALLRWRNPARGLVPPGDFIPLAEEIGLIGQIGAWVLRRACSDATRWPENVRVAVNLSPAQFRSSKALVHEVDAALDGSGLAPHRLELEITETVLLQDTEATLAVLNQLRSLGVRISMDDFGTGYSSLSYLRSFPFDKIKIDQSFVAGLSDSVDALPIIRAIAGLGTGLGISTTAEGVETIEQLECLRAEGCVEGQGYFFSAAIKADEVLSLVVEINKKLRSVA